MGEVEVKRGCAMVTCVVGWREQSRSRPAIALADAYQSLWSGWCTNGSAIPSPALKKQCMTTVIWSGGMKTEVVMGELIN